jgi:hypothetical protein
MRHSITTLAATTIIIVTTNSAVAGPGPRPDGPFGPHLLLLIRRPLIPAPGMV